MKYHQIVIILAAFALSLSMTACAKKNQAEKIRGGARPVAIDDKPTLDDSAELPEQASIEEGEPGEVIEEGSEEGSADNSDENKEKILTADQEDGSLIEQIYAVRANPQQENLTEESASADDRPELTVSNDSLANVMIGGSSSTNTTADVYAPEGGNPEDLDIPHEEVMIEQERLTQIAPEQDMSAYQEVNPIYTGGVDSQNRFFTDGKSDVIMARLIGRMNEQVNLESEVFFNDSVELAARLKNVDVSANIHNGAVSALVQFVEQDEDVEIVFEGRLQNRMAPMRQVSQTHGYSFNAYVTCIDANQAECKNTILVLEHIVNGEICKRLFVVHRFGDAKFTMADEDYVGYSGFINDNHRNFMEYMSNTAHFNRYLYSCVASNNNLLVRSQGDQSCNELQSQSAHGFNGRLPRARVLGYRTWAAAYGASYFNLFFREAQRGNDPIDVFHVYGPLLTSQNGVAYDRSLQVEGYLTTPSGQILRGTGQSFGEGIASAKLLSNDGHGYLDLSFTFRGHPRSTAYLDFQEMLGATLDPVRHHLYPSQPRGQAPRPLNLTEDGQVEGSESDAGSDSDEAVDTTAVPPEEMGS